MSLPLGPTYLTVAFFAAWSVGMIGLLSSLFVSDEWVIRKILVYTRAHATRLISARPLRAFERNTSGYRGPPQRIYKAEIAHEGSQEIRDCYLIYGHSFLGPLINRVVLLELPRKPGEEKWLAPDGPEF